MIEAAARHKRVKSKDKESSSLQQAVEICSLLLDGSLVAVATAAKPIEILIQMLWCDFSPGPLLVTGVCDASEARALGARWKTRIGTLLLKCAWAAARLLQSG